MITDIVLDHVAVAAGRVDATWPRYAGDLAGRYVSGGGGSGGFRASVFEYEGGMSLEVLEPYQVERNDFLQRFLDHTGPAPHHVTFKVPDLRAAIAEAEAAGISPVGIDLEDPHWKEAFLHPKQARGIVVQLAQVSGKERTPRIPDTLPAPRVPAPAALAHVAHAVADLDDGLAQFEGLLGGRRVDEGADGDARWVELAWPGAGRIRLLAPATPGTGEIAGWLEGRPGRVHHIAFRVQDPAGVAGAVPLGDDRWEVPPEANLGVRLRLQPPA